LVDPSPGREQGYPAARDYYQANRAGDRELVSSRRKGDLQDYSAIRGGFFSLQNPVKSC
jgi:hypothetical protein